MPTGRIIASPKGVASAAAPDRKQRRGRYAVVWPTGATDAGPTSNR